MLLEMDTKKTKTDKAAKNIEEALALAARELEVDIENLEYEIISEVGKGLMGLLVGREVTIRAWIKGTNKAKEDEKPAPEKDKKEQKNEKKAEQKRKEKVMVADKKTPEPKAPRAEKSESDKKEDEKALKSVDVGEIEAFINGLLEKMGITAEAKAKITENGLLVNIEGDKMGLIIGKRGETLNAIQYLAGIFVNKGKNGYVRVTVDTENYRAKREEALVRLAHSLEKRVINFGKAVTLEPMSPYERRIIHAALQENGRVKTYSTGDEPNRKVVVTLK